MAVEELLHTPGQIAAAALVQLGLGTDPDISNMADDWPVFFSSEPSGQDVPDDIITCRTTAGVQFGRTLDGDAQYQPGVLIRVRSADVRVGARKAAQIRSALLKVGMPLGGTPGLTIPLVDIDAPSGPPVLYVLDKFANVTDVLDLGATAPESERKIHTLNATLVVCVA